MATIGEMYVRIKPDASGFAGEASSAVSGALKAVAAIGAGIVIGKSLIDFFKSSVADAGTFNASMRISAQVIKDTGGTANVTAGQVGDLARSISVATGVSADNVAAAEQVILAHRGIRNELGAGSAVFNRTIQDSTDLAAVMGTDTTSAAKLLGKALDDPTKAAGALHRAGVILTQGQQDQIKAFVAAGNVLGAQKVVLDSLEKSVSGAAAAGASATDRLKASWSDLKLTMGQAIVPALGGISTALAAILPSVAPLVGELGTLIGSSLGALAPAILIIAQGMTSLGQALAPLIPMIGGVVTVLAGFVGQGLQLVASFLGPLLTTLGPVVGQFIRFASVLGGQLLAAITPLMPLLSSLAGTVFTAVFHGLDQVMAAVGPLLPTLAALGGQLLVAFAPAAVAVISQLAPALIPMVQEFVKLLPALVPIVQLFSRLVVFLSPALAQVIVSVAIGFKAWSIIGPLIAGITKAWEGLTAIMELNPFILIGVAVVALAYIIYRNWDTIVAAFHTAWHAIEGVMGSIADVFRSGWHTVQDFFAGIPAWFTSHWQLILAAMFGPLGLLVLYVKDHFSQVVSFLEGLPGIFLNAGVALMKGLLTGIVTGFVDTATFFLNLPFLILGWVVNVDVWLVKTGIKLLTGLINGIVQAAPVLVTWFVNLPGVILGLLVTAGVWLVNTGIRVLTGLVNGIVSAAPGIWSFFQSLPGTILGLLAGAAGWLLGIGGSVVSGLINGIVGAAPGIWNFFSGLPGAVVRALGSVGNMLFSVGQDIIRGLINGIEDMAGNLIGHVENILKRIPGVASILGLQGSPSPLFHEIGLDIMRGLTNGITAGAGGPLSATNNALGGIGGRPALGTGSRGAPATTSPAAARGGATLNFYGTVINDQSDVEGLMRKVNFAVTAGAL